MSTARGFPCIGYEVRCRLLRAAGWLCVARRVCPVKVAMVALGLFGSALSPLKSLSEKGVRDRPLTLLLRRAPLGKLDAPIR